ncbi:coiled-coil domain-containing protein [Facilibium subflavum]|uniref:hypothetical protein n=1 Tax=Facilibium subflavum TaxID=2219058 RepID=UPI000E64AE2A|nr:hypothetical protein [Facilibium subflavum]
MRPKNKKLKTKDTPNSEELHINNNEMPIQLQNILTRENQNLSKRINAITNLRNQLHLYGQDITVTVEINKAIKHYEKLIRKLQSLSSDQKVFFSREQLEAQKVQDNILEHYEEILYNQEDEIQTLKAENQHLQAQLKEKDETITSKENDLNDLWKENDAQATEIKNLESTIKNKDDNIKQLENENKNLENTVNDNREFYEESLRERKKSAINQSNNKYLLEQISSLQQEIEDLKKDNTKKDKQIGKLNKVLIDQKTKLDALQLNQKETEMETQSESSNGESLAGELGDNLLLENQALQSEIKKLQQALDSKTNEPDSQIASKDQDIASLEHKIHQLQMIIADYEARLARQQKRSGQKELFDNTDSTLEFNQGYDEEEIYEDDFEGYQSDDDEEILEEITVDPKYKDMPEDMLESDYDKAEEVVGSSLLDQVTEKAPVQTDEDELSDNSTKQTDNIREYTAGLAKSLLQSAIKSADSTDAQIISEASATLEENSDEAGPSSDVLQKVGDDSLKASLGHTVKTAGKTSAKQLIDLLVEAGIDKNKAHEVVQQLLWRTGIQPDDHGYITIDDKAFRQVSLLIHPDKQGSPEGLNLSGNAANELFNTLNNLRNQYNANPAQIPVADQQKQAIMAPVEDNYQEVPDGLVASVSEGSKDRQEELLNNKEALESQQNQTSKVVAASSSLPPLNNNKSNHQEWLAEVDSTLEFNQDYEEEMYEDDFEAYQSDDDEEIPEEITVDPKYKDMPEDMFESDYNKTTEPKLLQSIEPTIFTDKTSDIDQKSKQDKFQQGSPEISSNIQEISANDKASIAKQSETNKSSVNKAEFIFDTSEPESQQGNQDAMANGFLFPPDLERAKGFLEDAPKVKAVNVEYSAEDVNSPNRYFTFNIPESEANQSETGQNAYTDYTLREMPNNGVRLESNNSSDEAFCQMVEQMVGKIAKQSNQKQPTIKMNLTGEEESDFDYNEFFSKLLKSGAKVELLDSSADKVKEAFSQAQAKQSAELSYSDQSSEKDAGQSSILPSTPVQVTNQDHQRTHSFSSPSRQMQLGRETKNVHSKSFPPSLSLLQEAQEIQEVQEAWRSQSPG